jgi:SAM-dependent methyltransferase
MGGVPSALLHQLASSGIASEENGRWLATFRIVPVQGVFVLVDRPSRLPELGNAWVQFGIDTIQLASMIVHEARGGGRALDLCTGSGIQALLPSKRYAVTEGTDINPRAIAMAEANAAINGVGDRLQFWQGDLYDRAEGTYDLIVANPPFMFLPPDVAQTNLRGSGGALGIEVTLRVLEGLAGRLSEQGEAFTYTQGPRIAGRCQLVEATSRRLSGVPLEVEFEEILRGYWSAYHEFYRSAGVESLTCYRVRVKRASRFSVTVRPLRGWRRAAVSLGVALERWA